MGSLFFESLEDRQLFSALVVGVGQAFTTLQAAANAVSAGDTVVVEAGTYAGFQLIDRASGSAGAPIVFNFQSGAQIDSADGSTNDAIDIEGCKFVTVEGATITNPGGDISRAGIRLADCDNASILNNVVSGVGGWGIYTSHSSNALIQGNTSSDNGAHGIYIANSETNVQVLTNTLFNNANCGIQINGDASQGNSGLMTNLTIANNVIFGNGSTGGSAINCDGVQDSVIANNLIYDNQHTGIALFNDDSAAGPAGDVVANNTVVMPGLTAMEIDDSAAPSFIFKNILIGSLTIASGTATDANVTGGAVPAGLFAPGGFQVANPASGVGVGFGTDSDPATQLVFLQQPTDLTAGDGASSAFIVELEDQSGNLVINNRSRVTLSLTDGNGVTHVVGIATDFGGVAAFNNVVIDTAGTFTIQASDSTLTPAASTPVTIAPAAPAKLVYFAQPTAAVAGNTFNPVLTVALEDRFGNVATNATANVTLAVASGPIGSSVGGTATLAMSGGEASFDDVTLNTAGKYRLTASSDDGLSVLSKTIAVAPAAAANVSYLAAPGNVVAGHPFGPRIRVLVTDAFGNAVANGTSITLGITSGPAGGVITGKATAVTRNGIAMFPGAVFRMAGDYSLTATTGAASSVAAPFTVSPGPAARLVFTEAPADTTASTPFDVQFELLDKFGNVVTNNSTTALVTLGTHPRTALLGGTVSAAVANGLATFSGLSLDLAGTYTLRFADGRLRLSSAAIAIS